MKHCPVCNNSYPTNFRICPQDNTALRETNEIEPGMVIRSKYQILEHLGGGGMADVYRVKHLAFNEICAIKVVKAKYADDTAFNNRFRGEAVLTRKLRHPNAIAVEDYDTTEDGRPYIVMEFVKGRNLRTVIDEDGALPVRRALSIALQVARALAAAHKLGITHRDIKPDNILITEDERGNEAAKVLDFGIAKVKEGAFTMASYTATRKGMVVGTPQYMSPEQARGKVGDEIDSRVDIYSLGVVIYEMVTGRLPFESDTPMGYCLEHLHTVPVPPHEFCAARNIPVGLSQLVMKAMEKERGKRFSTIDEMIEALQDPERWAALSKSQAPTVVASVEEPIPSAPPPPKPTQIPQPNFGGARVKYTPLPPQPVKPSDRQRQSKPTIDSARPKKEKESHSTLITFVVVLVLAAGAGAYFWMSNNSQTVKPAPALQSSTPTASSPVQKPSAVSPQPPSTAEPKPQNDPSDPYAAIAKPIVPGVSAEAKRQSRELVSVAQVQMARADYAGAIGSYQEAVRLDPSNAAAKAGLKKARQEKAGNDLGFVPLAKPKEVVQPTVTPVFDSADNKRRARELAITGQQQIDGGYYATAVETFEQAVRLDPSNSTALAGLRKAQQAKRTEDEILQRRK
jgi:serine/threonine protein kinase